eukprot:1184768-Prymnesium_polylepis.1
MLRVITLDEKDRSELERLFPNDWYKLRSNLQTSAREMREEAERIAEGCRSGAADSARSAAHKDLPALHITLESHSRISAAAATRFVADATALEEDIAHALARAKGSLSALVCHLAGCGDERELLRLMAQVPISDIPADYDGRAGLHLAAAAGHDACVSALLRYGASINIVDRFGRTPLLEAVLSGKDHTAELLLQHRAQLGLREREVAVKLCDAANDSDHAMIRRYLDAGANPNASDYDGRSCLMLAAAGGNLGICRLLLERGADPSAQDRWGHTAGDEAKYHGHQGTILTMLEPLERPSCLPGGAAHEAPSQPADRPELVPLVQAVDHRTLTALHAAQHPP